MYLTNLELTGFRNYDQLQVEFSDAVNVFLGENAQGKTNLIESIYFLAFARSHRTSKDRELINWTHELTRVKSQLITEKTTYPLELQVSTRGKVAKMNHLEQKRLSQYVGHLNVILFAPEDLNLVKGSPSVRRKFIDMELGQMSPLYLHHLVEYQKLLKQRNTFIKKNYQSKNIDQVYWSVITEQMAKKACEVISYRAKFIQQLEEWANPIQDEISKGQEQLTIRYKTVIDQPREQDKKNVLKHLLDLYDKNFERDFERGTTIMGPHRDDVAFYVGDHNVQQFGSQGQQRTTALSVKLAEIELMQEMTGEYPILLLDDVLSELDDNRQTHLLKAIENKVQTFLTTTSLEGVKLDLLTKPKVFHVKQGEIVSRT